MANISLKKFEALTKTVGFLDNWQGLIKRKDLVKVFLNLLKQRKKTAAKRTLERIKKKYNPSQWRRGYIKALEGMLLVLDDRTNRNTFMDQITHEKSNKLRKLFIHQSKKNLHAEFDRGYFAAWAEYMLEFNKPVIVNMD